MSATYPIPRDVRSVDQGRFDLAVVGAGIQGILCALEATHRGFRTLIIDSADYGAATSFNSLRTLHGGLRYLQSLDFSRARSSNAQQRWWLEHFPDLVEIRPCVMPLAAWRLRGRTAFRIAGLLARLSGLRGLSAAAETQRPAVELLSAAELLDRLPDFPAQGLRGAALWYEVFMPETSRLLIECLRWAVAGGAVALNYVELVEARPERDARARLLLADRASGATISVVAGAVINAGGAQVDRVARRLGACNAPSLVPTIAWNLLLDARLPESSSIVLAPPRRGGQTYVLQPFHGRTLAGTGHAAWPEVAEGPLPTRASIDNMRRELAAAWPQARLGAATVLRVLAGILPGTQPGSSRLATRPRVVRDAVAGGTPLVHVVGVKFTEAPVVAARTLDSLGIASQPVQTSRPPAGEGWRLANGCEVATTQSLLNLAASESVVYLEDLIERRTNAWCDVAAAARTERLLEGKLARHGPGEPAMQGHEAGERTE